MTFNFAPLRRMLNTHIVGFGMLAVVLLIWGWILNLDYPSVFYFDEEFYVSASRQLLGGLINENWAHPLLAKSFIAIGINIFGDVAFGWRVSSALFSVGTFVLLYLLAFEIFRNSARAGLAVVLVFLNLTVCFFGRIAHLDAAMGFFILLGVLFACRADRYSALYPNKLARKAHLVASAASFFLAMGCKMYGGLGLILPILIMYQSDRTSSKLKFAFQISSVALVGCVLAVIGLLLLRQPGGDPYTVVRAIETLIQAVQAQWQYQVSDHPFSSSWYSWILGWRPYLAFFEASENTESVRGIAYTTNPVIMILGSISLIRLIAMAFRADRLAKGILLIFFAYWLPWAFTSRTTYIYHFYPATLLYGIMILAAFSNLKFQKTFWAISLCLAGLAFVLLVPFVSGEWQSAARAKLGYSIIGPQSDMRRYLQPDTQ